MIGGTAGHVPRCTVTRGLCISSQLYFMYFMDINSTKHFLHLPQQRGAILVIESPKASHNTTAVVWKEENRVCAAVGQMLCCSGALLGMGAWHHVAVAVSLVEGRVGVYVDGREVEKCVGETGVRAVPDGSSVSLFRGLRGTVHGRTAMPSFEGRVDELYFSTSEFPAKKVSALHTDACVNCLPCESVDISNIFTTLHETSPFLLSRHDSNGNTIPRTPLGNTPFYIKPKPARQAVFACTIAKAPKGDILVSLMIREGEVSLGAPFSGRSGCRVVCNADRGTATAKDCGRGWNSLASTSMSYVGGGWYQCTGRVLASATPDTLRGGLVASTAAIISGFYYRPAEACGDGVVDYPAELCDSGLVGVSNCLAPLCTPRSNPVFTSVTPTFRVETIGAYLDVKIAPAAPLKVFISRQQNCSDTTEHDMVLVEEGVAVFRTTDTAFSVGVEGVFAGHEMFLCGPLYANSDVETYRPLASWKAVRCVAMCKQGSVCNVLTGACVCQLGFTGPDCSVLVDGCAVAPDEAQCKHPSSMLPMALSTHADKMVLHIDPCTQSRCEQNGGACHLPGVCVCPQGFSPPHCDGCLPGRTGPLCNVFECSSLCLHGDCKTVYSFGGAAAELCLCSEGWTGVSCDRPSVMLAGTGEETQNSTTGVYVTSDGRMGIANEPVTIAVALPDENEFSLLEFSVKGSPGVRVGVCEVGSEGPIGGHSQSWGVELGSAAVAWHSGVQRGLGVFNATQVSVRLSRDTSVLSATFYEHSLHVFQHVCSTRLCYGCVYLPSGAQFTLL